MKKKRPVAWLVVLGLAGLVVTTCILGFPYIIAFFFAPRCIVEGSYVDTPWGIRLIQEVNVGDPVWSQGASGIWRVGTVTRVLPASALGYVRITLSDGQVLLATASHPISTPKGWVRADQLEWGRIVDGLEGPKTVMTIKSIYSAVRVYDLEVEPDANFVVSGVLVHNKSSNDRNASTSLKTITSAQADFRANDRDGNQVNDYWVGDVAGLYSQEYPAGYQIKLIELSIALADVAPVGNLSALGDAGPKSAYQYSAIPLKADGTRYDDGSHRNYEGYAVCAYPINRKAGRYTFIVNEESTIYRKAFDKPAPILRWPADLAAEGWEKLD